jgi:general secretion pathway protein F
MTRFRYRAMTPAGKIVTGLVEAPSEVGVIQYLRSINSYPISTRRERSFGHLLFQNGARAPSIRILARVTQELASLLAAGIELDRALGILENLEGLGPLKASLSSVRSLIRDGASFADALARQNCFPAFYVSTVRAGEYGGALETAMNRLADYLSRSVLVRESVTSALVYPSILLATAGGSICFMLIFVLPQFEPLFADANRTLPVSTRIVMAAGRGLANYWWLIAAGAGAILLWVRQLLQNPDSRMRFHAGLLRFPLFGRLIADAQFERFFRTLGTLLSNGVPLPSALAIASDTITNERIARSLRDTASRMREGEPLSERLHRTGLLSATALDLVRIGEETGKLDAMLLRQADLDAQRLKQSIDRLLALLVPALTIALGLIIAAIIASILVALLSINDLAMQ